MNNIAKSVVHGVGVALLGLVAVLVHLIPASIGDLTVYSVATAIVVYVGTFLENA